MKVYLVERGRKPTKIQGAYFPNLKRALRCQDYYGTGRIYEAHIKRKRLIRWGSKEWPKEEAS